MALEPNVVWVCYPGVESVDGIHFEEYLTRRYGEGKFGVIKGDEKAIFFYDRGHRDEFHAKYGGLTGHAVRKNPLGINPLIGAH